MKRKAVIGVTAVALAMVALSGCSKASELPPVMFGGYDGTPPPRSDEFVDSEDKGWRWNTVEVNTGDGRKVSCLQNWTGSETKIYRIAELECDFNNPLERDNEEPISENYAVQYLVMPDDTKIFCLVPDLVQRKANGMTCDFSTIG